MSCVVHLADHVGVVVGDEPEAPGAAGLLVVHDHGILHLAEPSHKTTYTRIQDNNTKTGLLTAITKEGHTINLEYSSIINIIIQVVNIHIILLYKTEAVWPMCNIQVIICLIL